MAIEFNQTLGDKEYLKIEDGDNYLRVLPHQSFTDKNANWYTTLYRYMINPKYLVPQGKGVDSSIKFHYSLDGRIHNKSDDFDPERCLLAIYRGYVFNRMKEKYSTKEERASFFKDHFFSPQKRRCFYTIIYRDYPLYQQSYMGMIDLPEKSFEKFQQYAREVGGSDNKLTHPENAYVFNIKRVKEESGFVKYEFSHKTEREEVKGKKATVDVENTLTEEQIGHLNEMTPIDKVYKGKYSFAHFKRQMDFLQWYDANVWVKLEGGEEHL